MFNKVTIAAGVILASVSTVSAYEDLENSLGHRYPFLERQYAPTATSRVAVRYAVTRPVVGSSQYVVEAPENKLGDRYPSLEQGYAAVASNIAGVRYVPTQRTASYSQYTVEASENKISDRYPLLEQQVAAQNVPSRRAASRRTSTVR